jgi:hypothetical protein
MRFWLPCLVVGALLVPNLVHANEHSADAGAGPSWGGGGSTLVGFRVGAGIEIDERHLGGFCCLGVVGDVSVRFGSPQSKAVTQVVSMIGPRLTLAKKWRHLPQVQVLFGNAYTNDGGTKENKAAVAYGAGYELVLGDARVGLTSYRGWALRAQADRVVRSGDNNDFTRGSVSLLYRFPRP